MPKPRIILPARLAPPHLAAVLKYFEATDRLSAGEWKLALEAFDVLGGATLMTGRRRRSFRQFYESTVERRHADRFLTEMLAADDPEVKGAFLQHQVAAAILANLEQEGLYHEDVADSEYVAAYCLYWWAAFARGYRFEAAVLGKLRAAGIAFVAHDLQVRAERISPYDLVVDRRLGDIKHTTYFLYTARSLPLKCDFYITQLYHAQRRRYVQIVILTEESWHDLNGPVKAATLETAADFFPEPVQIVFEGRRFVVVTFDLWKDRVKRRQEREN